MNTDNQNNENDENEDEYQLPEYSDDEDFRKQMNESIMHNLAKLEQESNFIPQIKNKKIKIKKQKLNNNISLGSFIKLSNNKPNIFVSQRKRDKIGEVKDRVFNPRYPPYLLVHKVKESHELNDNDFPSL
jgi:hypothetical protein